MPKTRQRDRVYWRAGRAYGDFRDLGGGRAALCLPGKRWAVTDPDIAAKLATDRVKELDARQRGIALQGSYQTRATLKDYVRDHLIKKAQTGKNNPGGSPAASSTSTGQSPSSGQGRAFTKSECPRSRRGLTISAGRRPAAGSA